MPVGAFASRDEKRGVFLRRGNEGELEHAGRENVAGSGFTLENKDVVQGRQWQDSSGLTGGGKAGIVIMKREREENSSQKGRNSTRVSIGKKRRRREKKDVERNSAYRRKSVRKKGTRRAGGRPVFSRKQTSTSSDRKVRIGSNRAFIFRRQKRGGGGFEGGKYNSERRGKAGREAEIAWRKGDKGGAPGKRNPLLLLEEIGKDERENK